jgi:predicted amidohydrolase YtcJ
MATQGITCEAAMASHAIQSPPAEFIAPATSITGSHNMRARAIAVVVLLGLLYIAAAFRAATQETSARAAVSQMSRADVVLLNGRVLTVDATDSIAQAVAVLNGKILAVGSDAAIRPLAGDGTTVIDLGGRTLTPGLIDSHAHITSMARLVTWIDLSTPLIKTIGDVVQHVEARVGTSKPGEWILGKGWDEGRLAERREILASDLDPISPANPVFLEHSSPRMAVVNRAALALAGIDKTTADPRAGKIDRLPDGNPSGVLRQTAVDLVRSRLPQLREDQLRNGLLAAFAALQKEGMTAVKLPTVDEDGWNMLRDLLLRDDFGLRVVALWLVNVGDDRAATLTAVDALINRIGPFTKRDSVRTDARLMSGGVKLLLDGSGLTRTAWMYSDFNRNFTDVEAGNSGMLLIPPDTYRDIVRRFHDAGIHVGTHAIGDKAIDLVVDTYSAVLAANPKGRLRHAIIHGVLPSDHALAAIADMQKKYDAGYLETQPTFMWWTGDTYAANLGSARAKRMVPLKTYLDRGIQWASGSDTLVTPFPARYGIWASVARRPLQGFYGMEPFGTSESIDVRHALRSYTIWAARQMFLEDHIGSIEPGKEADLAVWDRDPYSVATDQLRDMTCEMTILGGRIVHKTAAITVVVR